MKCFWNSQRLLCGASRCFHRLLLKLKSFIWSPIGNICVWLGCFHHKILVHQIHIICDKCGLFNSYHIWCVKTGTCSCAGRYKCFLSYCLFLAHKMLIKSAGAKSTSFVVVELWYGCKNFNYASLTLHTWNSREKNRKCCQKEISQIGNY